MDALTLALSDEVRPQASALGALMRSEGGAGDAADLIEGALRVDGRGHLSAR